MLEQGQNKSQATTNEINISQERDLNGQLS